MTKIPDDIKKLSFEKAMEELSEIVENLESGNIDLEKSIEYYTCLLYTSPSPRDRTRSRMPSSA